MFRLLKKNVKVSISLVLVCMFFVSCKNETKIACVGDSITEGSGLKVQSKTSYPFVLNRTLGDEFTVLNAGRSSATLQKSGNLPYWNCKEFANVFAFNPDVIIIKLGTNDTKPRNWNPTKYKEDYQALIDTFKTISTQPKIYICLPVPVFKTRWGINDSTIQHGILPILRDLASHNQLLIIDLYDLMKEEGSNFPDNIHPNELGAEAMARIVADAIK